jgi:RNA polymerase sigma-54 factor
MAIRAGLVQSTEMRTALLPRMLQGIEILQLPAIELAARLELEVERNELLELGPSTDAERPVSSEREREDAFDAEAFDRRRASPAEHDPKLALLANVPAAADDLRAHVAAQLALRDLSAALREKVGRLIELLDDRGLLPVGGRELGELLGPELVDDAVAVLRSLEPRGVGARSPIEAMLSQVADDDPDRSWIEAILREHLESLAKNRVPAVARALGLEVEEVAELVERIRSLDPWPGAAFTGQVAPPLRPDLVVLRERDGELTVVVDDFAVPALRLDGRYVRMVQSRSTPADVRSYLRGKMRSARDVIAAVAHRRETLARVGAAIVGCQPEFFERGIAGMRALRMADLAQILELHTSTVSRAIAAKSMQTEFGIVPLRKFFDGVRPGAEGSGGAGASGRSAVHTAIRSLVAGEDPRRPLSDDDLVTLLLRRGVQVARRTVTKYRRELEIPSSWQRRSHGRRR